MKLFKSKYQWGALLSSSSSCFIGTVDFTIINTALPSIQKELSATTVDLQWIMNIFFLALSVLIIIMGRLSDLFGRRLFNMIGLTLFGISSVFAGLATSPNWLIGCRLLQGIALAIIIPSSMSLINHAFHGDDKNKAIGIWSAITGVGLACGPVVGGLLVSTLGWRWVFFINIPFCAISLILNAFFVKESLNENTVRKIDPKGFFLQIIGLTSLIIAITEAPDWGWADPVTLCFFALAIIFLPMFYFSELHSKYPLIPFKQFHHREFLCCCMVLFCMLFFMSSCLFLIPLYLENIRHETAATSGLMLLSLTVCVVVFSPLIGNIIDKISAKTLILSGMFCFFLSAIVQILFQENSSVFVLLSAFILAGIAWALTRNPATAKGLAALPHSLSGSSSGVMWTFQNFGAAIGLAITATLFRNSYEPSLTHNAFMLGYRHAMYLLAGVSLGTFLVIAVFMRNSNAKMNKAS
ncbi:MAG: MFS transporter [Parachlamydiales bacterium]|nr:MFS transporter [Parachlamydiales bacterium]